MIMELEERIRERAHVIWEREGRPAGRAEIHWSLASAEVAGEAPAARPAPKPRARAAAAATTPKVEKAEKSPRAKRGARKAP